MLGRVVGYGVPSIKEFPLLLSFRATKKCYVKASVKLQRYEKKQKAYVCPAIRLDLGFLKRKFFGK